MAHVIESVVVHSPSGPVFLTAGDEVPEDLAALVRPDLLDEPIQAPEEPEAPDEPEETEEQDDAPKPTKRNTRK